MKIILPSSKSPALIKRISGIILFIGLGFKSYSVEKTAIASGNYADGVNWSPAGKPNCGDQVIIPAGITITLAEDENYYPGLGCETAMQYTIAGTFYLPQTRKLYLPCGSEITVLEGGLIDGEGDNNSQRIFICNVEVWSGQDLGAGPLFLSLSALPIELSNFIGQSYGDKNIISWETETEQNNDYFELERSEDAVSFNAINKIVSKAVNGNSNSKIQYESEDKNPVKGANYYRIKQTDLNKKISYSKIVSLTNTYESQILFTIYPNPNDGSFFIDLNGLENNKTVEMKFYDKTGKMVMNYFTDVYSIQSKVFSINVGDDYERGVYVVEFIVDEINYYSKLVLE